MALPGSRSGAHNLGGPRGICIFTVNMFVYVVACILKYPLYMACISVRLFRAKFPPLNWLSSQGMAKFFGKYEFLAFGPVMDKLLSYACDERVLASAMCRNFLFQIGGSNPKQLNEVWLLYVYHGGLKIVEGKNDKNYSWLALPNYWLLSETAK